jgi:hypothetical protein
MNFYQSVSPGIILNRIEDASILTIDSKPKLKDVPDISAVQNQNDYP